jgi:hypothetical protein
MIYVGCFCLTNGLVYMLKSFYGWPNKPATTVHESLNRHLQNKPNQQSRYNLHDLLTPVEHLCYYKYSLHPQKSFVAT